MTTLNTHLSDPIAAQVEQKLPFWPLILLFFPSVTFGLLTAEVAPWALLLSIIYVQRYSQWMLILLCWLIASATTTVINSGEVLEVVRSLAAYLNALLPLVLIASMSDQRVQQMAVAARTIFIVLLLIGLLQHFKLIVFLDAFLKTLIPRASAEALDFSGRGVTLLSSEPARAGVEAIFFYIFVRTCFIPSGYKVFADLGFSLFMLMLLQSAMALGLWGIYMALSYRFLALVTLLFLGSLIPLILSLELGGRSFELLQTISSAPADEARFYLLNTSGHRVISIYASYLYGFTNAFGGGVGNWKATSIDALHLTGIDLTQLNYFQKYGNGEAVSIRSSGFVSNFILDNGWIGTLLLLVFLWNLFSRVVSWNKQLLNLAIVLMIKTFFIGSVGTPVSFICAMLTFRYWSLLQRQQSNSTQITNQALQ